MTFSPALVSLPRCLSLPSALRVWADRDCIENWVITVTVRASVSVPLWNDFLLGGPRKHQTLSAVKEQAGVRSERIYVLGGGCKSLLMKSVFVHQRWEKLSPLFLLCCWCLSGMAEIWYRSQWLHWSKWIEGMCREYTSVSLTHYILFFI